METFGEYKPNIVVNMATQAGVRYSIENPDVYIQSNIVGFYNIPATGLRFFTVYDPMGRPDMAYFGFTDKYFAGESIKIFNNGDFDNDLYRDFTYIDDIVMGIQRLLGNPSNEEDAAPHRVFNIGNNSPEKLMTFIGVLEKALSEALGRDVEFNKVYEPIKPGDVPATYASTDLLQKAVGFKPETSIGEGLQ